MAGKTERLSPENQRLREAFATLLAKGNDQAGRWKPSWRRRAAASGPSQPLPKV